MVEQRLDKAMEAYGTAHALVYSGEDTSGYARRLNQEMKKLVTGDRGLFRYGDEEETRVACQKLEDMFLSLVPRHKAAETRLKWLATYYQKRQQTDDAIRLHRKLLAARPDDLSLYYQTASLYKSKNDHEAAITVLTRALDRFPDEWQVHYRVGLAYMQRAAKDLSASDKRRAVEHLEKALDLCGSGAKRRTVRRHIERARNLKIE
jgi:tetratricopeptide (TPR) repeat protein